MQKYYGVAGTNGYGVYNNWNQAKNARRYTSKYKVERFDTFKDAKGYAEDTYDSLQLYDDEECYIDEITRINWFYRKYYMSYEEYQEKMKKPEKPVPVKPLTKPFTIHVN